MDEIRFVDTASLASAIGDRKAVDALHARGGVRRKMRPPPPDKTPEDLWNRARQWQILKTPELRAEYADFYGFSISLVNWTIAIILVQKDHLFDLRELTEADVLINMGSLLSAIEVATGDRWPGGMSADETRELLLKVGGR
jgi:hypothetical protein